LQWQVREGRLWSPNPGGIDADWVWWGESSRIRKVGSAEETAPRTPGREDARAVPKNGRFDIAVT